MATVPEFAEPRPARHVLIAGVGYQNLRDLSVGPAIVPLLRDLAWPVGVEVDDLSFGPIAVVQRLQDRPGYYERIVLVASVQRGRRAGQVTCYRWGGQVPDEEEIQRRVGEAVTGTISLDNLLVIAQRFDALPSDVVVIEVEPEDTGWGPGFTPTVEQSMDEIIAAVRRAAMERRDG